MSLLIHSNDIERQMLIFKFTAGSRLKKANKHEDLPVAFLGKLFQRRFSDAVTEAKFY